MCLLGFRLTGVNKDRHYLNTETTEAGGTQLPENQGSVELKKSKLPEYLDNTRCGYYCRLSEDKLSAKYCGTGIHDDVGAVQANLPVPRDRVRFYFEITVENRGRSGQIAIGFTDEKFSLRQYPGLESNSYGYHGDDGILYRYPLVKSPPRRATFSAGDTVGAGLNYETKKIFFTKNGRLVGELAHDGSSDGQLMYPTIALLSPNGKVVANFGQSTFLFDPVQPPVSEGLPTYLDKWRCGYNCRLSEDKLSAEYSGTKDDGVGAVQANLPISFKKLRYYFEMTVENRGQSGKIAIGFTDENFSLCQYPGLASNTYGYHGDDGVLYRFPVLEPPPGATFSAGDTVGAGLNYETKKIFFTKNGRLVGKLAHGGLSDGPLMYPTIALHSLNGKVVANFGQSTFLFDPVQPPSSEGLPTYLDKWRCGYNCRLSEDKLSAEYSGTSDDGVGAVQANLPISLEKLRYYFEMTVENRGQSGKIAIGFTHENFSLRESLGLEFNSYGYDGSDGGLQCCGGVKSAFGPKFSSGDTVGAGLNYETRKVFFTKNGKLVGTAALDGTTGGLLYPTIGLEGPNDQVVVNFGQRPFVFDPVQLPSSESGGLPTYLDKWRCGFYCSLSEDKLSAEYSGSSDDGVGAVQANLPVLLDSLPYYFEMTVENPGIRKDIAIGFTGENFNFQRQPGCDSDSYGYHGKDGHLYRWSSEGAGLQGPFGPTFSAGDTVGAGLNYGTRKIFFTKNGKLVDKVVLYNTTEGPLYPTIGLHSPDEKVVVNLGQSRFVFDPVRPPASEDGLPTYLDNWRCGYYCSLSHDKLSASYSGTSDDLCGAVQANLPVALQRISYYFEISVENGGQGRSIAIGFTGENFVLRKQPGSEPDSYGYHGNDGSLHRGSKEGVPFGPSFSAGDTVGAGLNYETKEIFFTKNGKRVGTALLLDGSTEGPLYPTVGLGSPDEKVVVNFGQSRFLFGEPPVEP